MYGQKKSRRFDGFVEYAKRVSATCLVHWDRDRYSAPASFANRPVSLRVYPERIIVVTEGQIVCEHATFLPAPTNRRGPQRFTTGRDLAVIQRKPGALCSGVPFAELPPTFWALQPRVLKTPGGDREAVLAAIQLALEAGTPTKDAYPEPVTPLGRREADRRASFEAAQRLTLIIEPQADVDRYDALRKVREARPGRGAIIIILRSLKMQGMAQTVGELTEQGSPPSILSQVLKAETSDREVRSTPY
jgi:hypothetical protein